MKSSKTSTEHLRNKEHPENKPLASVRSRMKYRMKSLKHSGIYVPTYEYQGLSVKVQGQTLKLSPETEQMAVAWARKKLSVTSPPDKLFYRNFVEDFLKTLSAKPF